MSSIGEPIALVMSFMIVFVFTALIYLFMSNRCKHDWNVEWNNNILYKKECSKCHKTEIKHA